MDLVIIGVPYAGNEFDCGIGAAPGTWQASGLAGRLAPLVARAVWVTVPPPLADKTPQERRVAAARQVAETVRTVLMADAFPLVLGGDSTVMSLAAVAGLQQARRPPGLVWFEGQSDLSTPESLALLVGHQSSPMMSDIGTAAVPEWHALIAGPRLISERTRDYLETSAITCWTARDFDLAGAMELGREVGDWPQLYLHLDLQVLAKELLPATEDAPPGGLTVETVVAGIESISAAGRVSVLGVTGYNPDNDEHGIGLQTSLQLIESAVRIVAD